jgi:PKD repeat protein
LEQIDDVTSDGIKDVIVGDFIGNLYGLDATNGNQEYSTSLGSVIITRLVQLDDVNNDGHPDIIPAHSGSHVTQVIDGQTGDFIWTHPVADQPWNVEKISDITGDGINDVVVGTVYTNNYCYFLDGVDGSELHSINLGTPVDAISAIPDIVGDNSWEMVAGGRNGYVFCFSGGLDAIEIDAEFTVDITEGPVPLTVHFTDLSTAENPIISWEWDFDDDGVIDSEEQDPTWTYYEEGTYTVSLTISDGGFSDTETKEDYITVLPEEAALEIGEISGGLLRVTAEINNIGGTEVSEVNWSITLDGNFVILGKEYSDIISSIPINDTVTVTDKPVFGFGRVTITVTADAPGVSLVTKTVDGFIFLFLIIITG